MKKKMSKKKKPVKRKIDVVLESLLNLEQRTKELINRIEQLERIVCNTYNYPKPKDETKYWPNIPQREDNKYWNHSKPIVGYDSCTGEPIMMDSWGNSRG